MCTRLNWRTRLSIIPHWGWRHRTKLTGALTMFCGYVQNNEAQLGLMFSPQRQGYILVGAGFLVFLIGVYNTLVGQDAP